MVEFFSLSFRVFTPKILGVRIFRYNMVIKFISKEFLSKTSNSYFEYLTIGAQIVTSFSSNNSCGLFQTNAVESQSCVTGAHPLVTTELASSDIAAFLKYNTANF